MLLDPTQTDAPALYQALIGIVTPRPIAWVSTLDAQGRVNLAPFSFFNVFGSSPPVVIFSPSLRRDGSKKDTLNNIESTREFVVNAAVADLVLGEVVLIHVADEVLDGQGRIDPRKLRTIGRLGGNFYCHTSDLFEMRRPG